MSEKVNQPTFFDPITIGVFTIRQYNDRSFVVYLSKEMLLEYGLKSQFKLNYGKWNTYLKGGAGWVFPLSRKKDIMKLIVEKIENRDLINSIPEFLYKPEKVKQKAPKPVNRNYGSI